MKTFLKTIGSLQRVIHIKSRVISVIQLSVVGNSSSSSSSPLLSLVQVPAKLAINLSIHTQHTYDNGVDRTGDRVFRKIQLLHEEREEEKIF